MKFLSWLDVKSRIRKETDNFRQFPDGIENLRFYPDEIVVEQCIKNTAAVTQAFQAWFPNPDIYNLEENRIYLDIGRASLEISIETGMENHLIFRERPRFDTLYFSKTFLSGEAFDTVPKPHNKFIAFHSFKGGVGRTLHLAVMVEALEAILKEKNLTKKILVVDADLEAPGITFWERNRTGGAAETGFIQFLDTIQYADPEAGYSEDDVIHYFAEEIQRFEHEVGNIKLVVLPAFSDPLELFRIDVRPEHLSQDKNPWKLRVCIDQLATSIGADYVFVDLRAGISELSAPFLLDPYIDRFLITTLSEQSLVGTELVLKEMTKLKQGRSENQREMLPEIIISMVPVDQDENRLNDAKERFERAIFESNGETDQDSGTDLLSDPISIRTTPFKTELLNVGSWEDIWTNAGSLVEIFRDDFQVVEGLDDIEEDIMSDDVGQISPVKKLEKFCSEHVFAEHTDKQDFLVTNFFKEFPRQFFNTLPLVVSLGTKGSGKTFHFMRMAGFMTYQKFSHAIEPGRVKIDADFLPLLRSPEIDGTSLLISKLKENQELFRKFDADDFKMNIGQFRDESHSDHEWEKFWEKQIIHAVSEHKNTAQTWRQLNEAFKDRPVIFLLDGLENLFPDIHIKESHQNAVSALLKIPSRLGEIRDRNIGIIIFLRQDYLDSALRQNMGQFEKKYENYKLLWDRTAFLRLVFWLALRSGAMKTDNNLDPASMASNKLEKELKPFWGLKLGNDNSKEANTINWIYGALSDFNGYLQARDVVRFLEQAAKASETTSHSKWKDRLLPPVAIRGAMNGCSSERVKELQQESKVFETWVKDLETRDDLVIPFSKTLLGDDNSRTLIELKKLGVVYEDTSDSNENRYYIPEIYRLGLGFKFKQGARPKVLSIKRKAIGKKLSS
nr:hypothetical protein [uncultured Desulfobacter sp.]